jgi:sodium-dependent dicarboxylate transporter 2/3/5
VTTIQSVCIFLGGYLVSRLLLRAEGHEVFVAWLVRRSGGRVAHIVLGLMLGAFALSTFVPNALTVLALIPVVAAIRRSVDTEAAGGRFGTLLALGVIYGGNIGGLASLVGSPANLYLLVNLRIFKVAGREALHFVSWLVFGMPMALGFLLICWLLLGFVERGGMKVRVGATEPATPTRAPNPLLPLARRWALLWFGFWVALLALTLAAHLGRAPLYSGQLAGEPFQVLTSDAAGALFTLLLVAGLFLWPQRLGEGRQAPLGLRDLWREVPLRGVAFGVGVLVLLVVLAKSGLVGFLGRVVGLVVPESVGPFPAALAVVLVTIFATEVLSNTAVATVMFPLSAALAGRVGMASLHLMLAVSLASTCAFMTPVATPVNALAFAGIGGVSLGTFAKTGALANLAGALWITAWIRWLVPHVLGWFA